MRVAFTGGRAFERPTEVLRAATGAEARAALQRCDEALDAGYCIAGYLSYELGAELAGLNYRTPERGLLCIGIYARQAKLDLACGGAEFAAGPLLPRMAPNVSTAPPAVYAEAIGRIRDLICDGDVYQVNYTLPFDFIFRGDPLAYYLRLARPSGSRYCAYVEDEDWAIASISPELFLRFDQRQLTARPMKGTAARDRESELLLPKNRAEHVMIVDLLRNDLQRICDDVHVAQLFEVERYPALATMTSTISGTLRARTPMLAILEATFPCGSVTGAPKRAAMQTIGALERWPRGAYTGSIGYLTPDRTGSWNVAIRTAQLDLKRGSGRIDVGGGIVADSHPDSEWAEVLLKAQFAAAAISPFDLLETFRIGDIDAHLRRLRTSAAAFGIAADGGELRRVAEIAASKRDVVVRLRLNSEGARAQSEDFAAETGSLRVWISSVRVFSDDPMIRHKTSFREAYDAAHAEASAHGCTEGILQNERNEITEGSRTNVFVKRGALLVTPPLACGVLPGILRERLIEQGAAVEGLLYADDLIEGETYVGNSARGLMRAEVHCARDQRSGLTLGVRS